MNLAFFFSQYILNKKLILTSIGILLILFVVNYFLGFSKFTQIVYVSAERTIEPDFDEFVRKLSLFTRMDPYYHKQNIQLNFVKRSGDSFSVQITSTNSDTLKQASAKLRNAALLMQNENYNKLVTECSLALRAAIEEIKINSNILDSVKNLEPINLRPKSCVHIFRSLEKLVIPYNKQKNLELFSTTIIKELQSDLKYLSQLNSDSFIKIEVSGQLRNSIYLVFLKLFFSVLILHLGLASFSALLNKNDLNFKRDHPC